MKFILDRDPPDLTCTIGHLWVDSQPFCDTLEPVNPIPAGTYEVILTESPKAKAGVLWTPRADFALPLLVAVPGHNGIRMHAGDTSADTEDCILVGTWTGGEQISNSRAALRALIDLISTALGNAQTVTIAVNNPL